MSAYNDYYSNLLKQYLPNQNQFQKTPDQITQEQKIQAYQVFITTKEGIEAVTELNTKFGSWFDTTYGIKHSDTPNEVKELKEMVLKMTSQIEMYFNSVGQTGTIDWGDGNTEPFDAGIFSSTLSTHNYATSGDYVIKVYLDDAPQLYGFKDISSVSIGTDIFLETTLTNFNYFSVDYSAQFSSIPTAIMDRALDMDNLSMGRSVFSAIDVTMFTNLTVTGFSSSATLVSLNISNLSFKMLSNRVRCC